jgi:hypothetical protein
MNGNLSIIMSVILVTAAILTVQSLSMLQISYAQSRLDANTQNTILNMHNQERNAVRVPQVTWSNSLATDAQAWADHIVSLNLRWDLCGTPQDPNFRQCPPHAPRDQSRGQGENLAWGYNTPVVSLAQSWANEKSNYAPGTPIAGNLAGPNGVYGHYTQMVWSSTTQIGCGIAQQQIGANVWDMLVCRYSPGGNIIGQPAYPVGAQAVGEEETTLGDQGAAQQDAGAPPADQAVVEEEVQESEVIQEVPQ